MGKTDNLKTLPHKVIEKMAYDAGFIHHDHSLMGETINKYMWIQHGTGPEWKLLTGHYGEGSHVYFADKKNANDYGSLRVNKGDADYYTVKEITKGSISYPYFWENALWNDSYVVRNRLADDAIAYDGTVIVENLSKKDSYHHYMSGAPVYAVMLYSAYSCTRYSKYCYDPEHTSDDYIDDRDGGVVKCYPDVDSYLWNQGLTYYRWYSDDWDSYVKDLKAPAFKKHKIANAIKAVNSGEDAWDVFSEY